MLPDRSISENLNFVMRATGWKDSVRIKTRIAEVLMLVGLGASERKMPHQLSGGEQQRAAIARALLNEPRILFADEPTGNVDPVLAKRLLHLFLELNRLGTTMLIATHDKGLVRQAERPVLHLEQGSLNLQ